MYPQKEITKTGDKVFLPFALTCHITRPKRATLLRVIAVMFTWFYTVTKNTSDVDPHSAASIMFQCSCFISILIYYSG